MGKLTYKDLLDNGVHFGHLTRKWDPKMAPYIFMEKNGIHIIDLNKTLASLDQACDTLKGIVRSGRKIMFVATKKQAQESVATEAARLNMPFATERWLGGMLTNFSTVRKSLKKMTSIEKLMKDDQFKSLAKRERLMMVREKDKLKRVLGGVADLTRLPAALFVIDTKNEHIAVAEAKRLGIPVIGVCDTNCNPEDVDFVIPANDDAFKSINVIVKAVGLAIQEGLEERKQAKDEQKLQDMEKEKVAADKAEAPKTEAKEATKATAPKAEAKEAAPKAEAKPKKTTKKAPAKKAAADKE